MYSHFTRFAITQVPIVGYNAYYIIWLISHEDIGTVSKNNTSWSLLLKKICKNGYT